MAVTKKAAAKPAEAKQAEPAKLAPATEFAASGAVIEPAIVADVDMGHPSVDDNPRKHSTADMNRIDFNEPSGLTPPEEAVVKDLKDAD